MSRFDFRATKAPAWGPSAMLGSPDSDASFASAVPAEVTALLSSASFDPASCARLEQYVQEQVAGSAVYDFDANLALLRLYQFFPETLKLDCVVPALALALKHLPAPDFNLLLAVLSRAALADERVAGLVRLADALEAGRFHGVWGADFAAARGAAPGMDAAIRTYALSLMTATFRNAEAAAVGAVLGLAGAELAACLSSNGLAVEGGAVRFPEHAQSANEVAPPLPPTQTDQLTGLVQLLVPAGQR